MKNISTLQLELQQEITTINVIRQYLRLDKANQSGAEKNYNVTINVGKIEKCNLGFFIKWAFLNALLAIIMSQFKPLEKTY